jgi:hypothetical protein
VRGDLHAHVLDRIAARLVICEVYAIDVDEGVHEAGHYRMFAGG